MIGRISITEIPQLQERLTEWLRACSSPTLPWPYEWRVVTDPPGHQDELLMVIRTWSGNGQARVFEAVCKARVFRHIRKARPDEPAPDILPETMASGAGFTLGPQELELRWPEGDEWVTVGLHFDARRIEEMLRKVHAVHAPIRLWGAGVPCW
jgi:hypothetical protein